MISTVIIVILLVILASSWKYHLKILDEKDYFEERSMDWENEYWNLRNKVVADHPDYEIRLSWAKIGLENCIKRSGTNDQSR